MAEKAKFIAVIRKTISRETFDSWKNQPILSDEDQWGGKYKTYGEMWTGEGYDIEEGKTYTIKGTVKEHSEYKGTKQTILTRCKIAE